MDSVDTYWADRALLEWQLELGADEAISETPVNRYALEATKPKISPTPDAAPAGTGRPALAVPAAIDAVAMAQAAATEAAHLEALGAAVARFEHCALKKGARKMVFADGLPGARVMIVGESPTREEDVAGTPFVGVQGELLNKMTGAIGLTRDNADAEGAVYLTTALPWRVPGDGFPNPKDMAMMQPFLARHIALANPDILILMGNTACQMLLGKGAVNRMRGKWQEVFGRPAMPMVHPMTLLKTPLAKRDAWADLLEVQAKLRSLSA